MQQNPTLNSVVFVDLNVLPEELRPQRYTARVIVAAFVVVILSVLLIPLSGLERAGDADTSRLSGRLELLSGRLAQQQIDFGKAREALIRLEATEAAIAEAEAARRGVLGNQRLLADDLSAVIAALPPGARLEMITGEGAEITLTGRAGSASVALEYSEALESSGRFSQVQVDSLAMVGGGSSAIFAITATR